VSVPVLSEAVICLLVVLIEILQPTDAVTVDYLQNFAPTMVVQISPALNSDNDVYLISASPVPGSTAETVSVRIEQSDLYAHNYVVYAPGSPPTVLDLTSIRRGLAGVNLGMGAGSGINLTREMDSVTSGPLHLLNRPPYIMLAAPAEAILLIAR